MKRFPVLLHVAALLCAGFVAPARSADNDNDTKSFPRGAKPSPRHALLGAPQHKPLADVPAQIAYVPETLDFWGNNQFGDCVTAEECFAKACHSPEIFVTAADAEAWARSHGVLNGSDLVTVLKAMQTDGLPSGGQLYEDGPYSSVDYSSESVLQSAISVGPVKIAIDASALPGTAGNQQGWCALGDAKQYPNTDHCVSICGFGPAEYLYGQLKLPTPAALAGRSGYLVFSWSSIGFVDHAWLMSTTAEAWVRNPTTPSPSPTPAPPKHRLTFAELIQLLIARLHPHLTPGQAEAVAEFFADANSPRVRLLERIVYRRARHAGLNLPEIGAVNWQELLQIVEELEPIILPLIPLLFGDESSDAVEKPVSHVAPARSIFRLSTARRNPKSQLKNPKWVCGPYGCKLVPIESNEKTGSGFNVQEPSGYPVTRKRKPRFARRTTSSLTP